LKEWALLILLFNRSRVFLVFLFPWLWFLQSSQLHIINVLSFLYLTHIIITWLIRGYISRAGCTSATDMYLIKQYMQIIKVLRPLFSEPHMVAFDTFLRIIAPLKLNETKSSLASNTIWKHWKWTMNNDSKVLTARCSSHHSLEHSTVHFASFHPSPVALFFNSMNHLYSFFILSHLFLSCFFVSFWPVFSSCLDITFFQPVLLKNPNGLFPAYISPLQISIKCLTLASHQSALSAILEWRKKTLIQFSYHNMTTSITPIYAVISTRRKKYPLYCKGRRSDTSTTQELVSISILLFFNSSMVYLVWHKYISHNTVYKTFMCTSQFTTRMNKPCVCFLNILHESIMVIYLYLWDSIEHNGEFSMLELLETHLESWLTQSRPLECPQIRGCQPRICAAAGSCSLVRGGDERGGHQHGPRREVGGIPLEAAARCDGERAAGARCDGQGGGGPLRRRKGGGPRGGREGGMRSCRGGAAAVADDEGSDAAGPCANPRAACGCGQRRAMVLDQRKRWERWKISNRYVVICGKLVIWCKTNPSQPVKSG